MLMAVQGSQAVVYVYELVDGKQKVSQVAFTKSGTEIIKKEEKKVEEKAEEKKVPEKEAEDKSPPVKADTTEETEHLE